MPVKIVMLGGRRKPLKFPSKFLVVVVLGRILSKFLCEDIAVISLDLLLDRHTGVCLQVDVF